MNLRTWIWLAALALGALGRCFGDDRLSAAAVLIALAAFWLVSPRALRFGVGALFLGAAAALIAGGVGLTIDLLPSLAAAMVGWLFARSLCGGRTPLIARAIAAIDGIEYLQDPAAMRYATRLTRFWAVYQALLVAAGLSCAAHARGVWPALALPSPRQFGAAILPIAVAVLFCAEFALRPWLLPQAPRHRFIAFLRDLARVWPELVEK